MNYKLTIKKYLQKKNNLLIGAVSVVLLIILPVTVALNSQKQNIMSKAAGVSSIEAESGVATGNVTITDDSNASGGKYVKFGSATPTGTNPWSVPFLEREPSGPITCNGQSNVTINGKEFVGIGNDQSSIRITNCHNVIITANDFKDVAQPITVENSTNVKITWNRYQNITGPHQRNGSNRANFTQWVNSRGGVISDNKGIGGDTEDIISIYRSGGIDASNPLIIERNAFEGTNWTSTSGSGMMLGDDGGSHIVVRNNTLLNPGQVGIGIASGTDIHITDNVIYGEKRTSSNIGFYIWNQYSTSCSGNEVARNKVKWFDASGSLNPAWNAGNCGTVTGWSTNDWNAAIDPATLKVTL